MAFNRHERALNAKKSNSPIFRRGVPDNKEGFNGDVAYIDIDGVGTVQYVKKDNSWIPIVSGDIKNQLSNNPSLSQYVDNSIINWVESNKSYINIIVNSRLPRIFTFPFYLHGYMDGSVLHPPAGVILPGISDMGLIAALSTGDITSTTTTLNHNFFPFDCVAKRIRCSSHHDGMPTDMETARLQFILEAYEPNGGSSLGSMSTSIATPTTVSTTNFNYWDFTDFTNITIPMDASWLFLPNRQTEPTVNKFESISGILTFEEVL